MRRDVDHETALSRLRQLTLRVLPAQKVQSQTLVKRSHLVAWAELERALRRAGKSLVDPDYAAVRSFLERLDWLGCHSGPRIGER